MDFVKILKSKPHNEHYLNRYIKFIQYYILNQTLCQDYKEKHHICPKANDMFPEYANLKIHNWNCVTLPFRAHIIAHYLLMKSYNNISQILSVIRTYGQIHSKNKLNSKLIEIAKRKLSEERIGKFSRGYDNNGKPIVSEITKKKISQIKKQYYSNPENRKKQSIACKGSVGRKSTKYSIAAKNRTEEHKKNLRDGVINYYSSLSDMQRKRINKGIYLTPIGNFTYPPSKLRNYCINNDKIINIHNIKSSPILNHSVIGMKLSDLGFGFISKNDPIISQYYDDLNLVHRPEPNHPLSLTLNDFLLHEKLLP